jgi:hypothetical protein
MGYMRRLDQIYFNYEDWTSYFDFVLLCKKRFYELMKKFFGIYNKKQASNNFISSSNTQRKEKPLAACLCPLQNPKITKK